MSFFPQAFAIVVGEEGDYSNDPKDPGGETRWGISKRAYPHLDIAQLTLEEAQAIYLRDYWTPCGCDAMSWERALCAFDCAVNQGQHAEEILDAHSHDAIELMTQRALRYVLDRNIARYGHSWFHRLFEIFKLAQVTPK